MSKTIYITEEQEQALVDKYLTEALVVNSNQVSDIVNYLNKFFHPSIDYAGDIGNDGLPCQTLGIDYIVDGQPLQKLQRKELLDVINSKFKKFVTDDASRMAYYDQILTDWLNKQVKMTGQLTVNVIGDDAIAKFAKTIKKPDNKQVNKFNSTGKDTSNNKNNKNNKSKDTK